MVLVLYHSCNFSCHICSILFIWTQIYLYSLRISQIIVDFFTFVYNNYLPFVISVFKVPENVNCDCMWQMSKSILQFILSNFLLHLVYLSIELFVYLKLVSLMQKPSSQSCEADIWWHYYKCQWCSQTLRLGYDVKYQEKRHDKNYILELIFDPESDMEVARDCM
jgi:hypothetical protein